MRSAFSPAATALTAAALIAAAAWATPNPARADPANDPMVWAGAVCNNPQGPTYRPVVTQFDTAFAPLRRASFLRGCGYYHPLDETISGPDHDLSIDIGDYQSVQDAIADITDFAKMNYPVLAYAFKKTDGWFVSIVSARAMVGDPPAEVVAGAPGHLAPLQRFGFQVCNRSTCS